MPPGSKVQKNKKNSAIKYCEASGHRPLKSKSCQLVNIYKQTTLNSAVIFHPIGAKNKAMPSILGRNPFHHKLSSETSLDSNNVENRSRSFLGFMNRTNTADSHDSSKSRHSVVSQDQHPQHHTRHVQQDHHHEPKHNSSMNELKRFFRPSIRKKSTTSLHPPLHYNSSADHHSHTQSAIPPSSDSSLSLSNRTSIYHDDSLLAQKYGKLGKILGSGAGGSVRVLVRPSDGATFAVKEFRPRKPNEQVKDYAKKCTAEFCIGSTLHHPNIIETLDIFSDSHQNKYYEVMEYCPIDFFAVVMSGRMGRGEINCCLKQLTEGVRYLHSMGLAHRDLKLDNCVMTHDGILKLIDFGSAVVFKYPFDTDVTMAHGIVGSDPYLAPEVLTSTKRYDPQGVDIWSIGIIYCCMMLKRFPWKAPRDSDSNFKLYCMQDDMEHDYVKSAEEHEKLLQKRKEDRSRAKREHEKEEREREEHGKEDHGKEEPEKESVSEPRECSSKEQQPSSNSKEAHNHLHSKEEHEQLRPKQTHESRDSSQPRQRRVIHGPYRLLRLLPHASRPIMSHILQVDPTKRATLQDMFDDEWFSNIPFCTVDEKKRVVRAPGHSHTIVEEESAHLETYKV